LTKLASWPAKAIYKLLGARLRKNKSHQSITVVRLGSAAGVEGPQIYLAKGKELTVASMTKTNFSRIHKAPTGSYVKMTPNAHMTNEVWLDIAPSLCKLIGSMKGNL
jgi:hypothetical protein